MKRAPTRTPSTPTSMDRGSGVHQSRILPTSIASRGPPAIRSAHAAADLQKLRAGSAWVAHEANRTDTVAVATNRAPSVHHGCVAGSVNLLATTTVSKRRGVRRVKPRDAPPAGCRVEWSGWVRAR